jgi:hypothetical protein
VLASPRLHALETPPGRLYCRKPAALTGLKPVTPLH